MFSGFCDRIIIAVYGRREYWQICLTFVTETNKVQYILIGFLFLLYVGEIMNALLSPQQALSPQLRRHLSIAIALCGISALITPYGPDYLWDVLSLLVIGDENLKTVKAYFSIFSTVGRAMHLHELGIIGLVVLLALFIPHCRARQIDWSLLLVNLCFSVFFTFFLRVAYFWAIIFGFSILLLLTRRSSWVWHQRGMTAASLAAVILFCSLFLSGRALREHLCRPAVTDWSAFGTGHVNPVEEA